MKKKYYILSFAFSLFGNFSFSQKIDSLQLNIYSGFGEQVIKKNYHIIYKLNYRDKYFRDKILYITADSVYLKKNGNIPVDKISEIGYYGKTDKYIKAGGIVMAGITAELLRLFIIESTFKADANNDVHITYGNLTSAAVTGAISAALIFTKRKLYKIPNPWKISVGGTLKSGFIFK